MKKLVFISHSDGDSEAARRFCDLLEDNGISCWIAPRDVPAAAEYGEAIVDAVEASKVLLLLLSQSSNASRFVMREVSLALDSEIPILPVRLGDVLPSKSLKFFIQGLQRLDAFPPPLDQHIHKVIQHLGPALSESSISIEDQLVAEETDGEEISQLPDAAQRVVTELVRGEIQKYGFSDMNISNNLLIFNTKKQKTWLSFTNKGVFCVLDSRPKGGRIRVQWFEPILGISSANVSAMDREGRPGLLRVGSHRNWLYTKALFGSAERLRQTILSESERARR